MVRKCVQRVFLPPKNCLYLHVTHETEGDIPMHPTPSNSLLPVHSEALQFAENITKVSTLQPKNYLFIQKQR
jgi:hypothetical protein